MDPEEYQQTLRETWGGVTRLVGYLGSVVLSALVIFVAVWLIWRFWDRLIGAFDVGLSWLSGAAVSRVVVVLVQRDRIRGCFALAGATCTLAVGTTAGVFQLDGGWWLRNKQFWYRTPEELETALRLWVVNDQKQQRKGRRRVRDRYVSGRPRGPVRE